MIMTPERREEVRRSPMTVGAVAIFVARELAPFIKRIDELEQRCAEAERKAAAAGERYKGVFQRAQAEEYSAGSWVTHSGSMWVALRSAPGVPGEGDGWQLAVKRGSDGRDAR